MQNKAYFFVNGNLFKKEDNLKDSNIDDEYILNLDSKYNYEVYNFGVSRNFNDCKIGALKDVVTDVSGNRMIIPNTYVAIFEIALNESEYQNIDEESMLAEFDILDKIKNLESKIAYNCMFDKNKNLIENFIDIK